MVIPWKYATGKSQCFGPVESLHRQLLWLPNPAFVSRTPQDTCLFLIIRTTNCLCHHRHLRDHIIIRIGFPSCLVEVVYSTSVLVLVHLVTVFLLVLYSGEIVLLKRPDPVIFSLLVLPTIILLLSRPQLAFLNINN
jgi:hypothetical protein